MALVIFNRDAKLVGKDFFRFEEECGYLKRYKHVVRVSFDDNVDMQKVSNEIKAGVRYRMDIRVVKTDYEQSLLISPEKKKTNKLYAVFLPSTNVYGHEILLGKPFITLESIHKWTSVFVFNSLRDENDKIVVKEFNRDEGIVRYEFFSGWIKDV